jgi:hypothetical protein
MSYTAQIADIISKRQAGAMRLKSAAIGGVLAAVIVAGAEGGAVVVGNFPKDALRP